MARKEMYTLKVDGRVVWTSNRLPYMKKIANETLELDNGFFAEILRYNKTYSDPLLQHEVEPLKGGCLMALYAVYYQTGISPLDGAPLCTIDLVTQVEATAIAKQQELTDAGLVAWHEQIQ